MSLHERLLVMQIRRSGHRFRSPRYVADSTVITGCVALEDSRISRLNLGSWTSHFLMNFSHKFVKIVAISDEL